MKLILASQSEWRKKLLTLLQLPFEVLPSGVDESVYDVPEPEALVAMLAAAKARTVVGMLKESTERTLGDERTLVIGADTVVVHGGEIIGKPDGREDARRIISQLAGGTHEVITGVCVHELDTDEKLVEVEGSMVSFLPMSEEQVDAYLKAGDWQGKAGGYQLLRAIEKHVKDVEGSASNVIGLPLETVSQMLEEFGVGVGVDTKALDRRMRSMEDNE